MLRRIISREAVSPCIKCFENLTPGIKLIMVKEITSLLLTNELHKSCLYLFRYLFLLCGYIKSNIFNLSLIQIKY